MAIVQILQDETSAEMADKIFRHFDNGQSCTIEGFIIDETHRKVKLKGQYVWELIVELDLKENWIKDNQRVRRRKAKMPPNSCGGPVAGKIFRFKDNPQEEKFSIWRIQ